MSFVEGSAPRNFVTPACELAEAADELARRALPAGQAGLQVARLRW